MIGLQHEVPRVPRVILTSIFSVDLYSRLRKCPSGEDGRKLVIWFIPGIPEFRIQLRLQKVLKQRPDNISESEPRVRPHIFEEAPATDLQPRQLTYAERDHQPADVPPSARRIRIRVRRLLQLSGNEPEVHSERPQRHRPI